MKKIIASSLFYYQFKLFSPFHNTIIHGVFPRSRLNSRLKRSRDQTKHGFIKSDVSLNVKYGFESDEMVNEHRRLIIDAVKVIGKSGNTIAPRNINVSDNENTLKNKIVSAYQTHGDLISIETLPRSITREVDEVPDVDAFITDRAGILLMLKTADCQPILIYDPIKNIIAAVHSGWRGTLQNIVGKTIQKMMRDFHSRPGDIRVTIGPSLQKCCSEFRSREKDFKHFESYFLPNDRVDLLRISFDQLNQSGIREEHVEISDICTSCASDTFFSYRKDRPDQGRFATVIGLR
ncbi:peptidoglycan editing factor PgeF [Candidatus Peregrinibacteria bacterium]|nr:peptidoglycan editing factor PgeF [Candidatus Peregrinibacteria bacterium]